MIAGVPSYSLIMACLYYSVFFANFKGLDLNILTLSDYFNKAVEFIPLAFFTIFGLLFALFMYPPKHKSETDEEHRKRIGFPRKIDEILHKSLTILLYTGVPIFIAFLFFTMPLREFLYGTTFFFLLYIILFMQKMRKHFSPELSEFVYSKSVSYTHLTLPTILLV